jgi:hypothetical protein
VFNIEKELLEHEMVHREKMQIYKCEECGKVFGSAHELSEHELTHGPEGVGA